MESSAATVSFSDEKYDKPNKVEESTAAITNLVQQSAKLTRYRLIVDITNDGQAFEDYGQLKLLFYMIYSQAGPKLKLNPLFDLIITISKNYPLNDDHPYIKALNVIYKGDTARSPFGEVVPKHMLNSECGEQVDFEFVEKLRTPSSVNRAEKYSAACLGGTFDYLHVGHKLLLTNALFLTENLLIGLTAEELLLKKSSKCALESYASRYQHLRNFITLVASTQKFDIDAISDPAGPAATVKELEGIIVTDETRKGADFVNQKRIENQLEPLKVAVIELINFSTNEKLSSTDIRKHIISQVRGGEEALQQLYSQWQSLNQRLGIKNDDLVSIWFDRFKRFFSEPWRHYHNFNHVASLLELIPQIKTSKDDIILELAAWFHDVIYVPVRSDNEELSAKLFIKYADEIAQDNQQRVLDAKMIAAVNDIILYTKNHMQESEKLDGDVNAQVFLDMDISILGSDSANYDQYSKTIRLEYSHIEEAAFKIGRTKVLKGFLNAPRKLYRTEELQQRYEEQARSNIQREVDMLSD